jgi:undecaprenyl-phosphate galactose phosphotransferase
VTVAEQTAAERIALAPGLDLDAIELAFCQPSRMRDTVKRTFDIMLGISLLVIASPLLLIIAVIVALQFRRNPLFAHERVGRDGVPFKCLKFRTMRDPEPEEEREFHPEFKDGTDTRTTRVTSFLRRTSLDELPQLLNVVGGDMSIVGPRPVVPEELRLHFGETAPILLMAKPGMTGLWTVSGRSDVPYPERTLIELRYVTTMSFVQDLSIIGRTVVAVISGRGAL